MPRISKIRLSRIDTRLSQRCGEPEDFGELLNRLASSDFEAADRFGEFCRTMADHPDDEALLCAALNRFFDRINLVVKENPAIVRC